MSWLKFYIHRYIRLTPLYMIVFGIFTTTSPYLPDGPFFQHSQQIDCTKYWWKHLLYIQNFFSGSSSICFGWSWYIANDFLYYLLSPLILVPLFYRPVVGYLVAAFFFLGTTITPFVLTMMYYLQPGIGKVAGHEQTGDWMFLYYYVRYSLILYFIDRLI